MKFVFLSVFKPFRGGISQFSEELYKALSKKNEVVKINFKRQYPNFLFPGKSQFEEGDRNDDKLKGERVLDSINPISFKKTAKQINRENGEVLLVNYWMSFFALAKGFIAKKSKKHIKIAILHNLIPHEKKFYDRIVNRYFVKHFDGFVVMSNKVKSDLLNLRPNAKYIELQHPLYEHFGQKIVKLEALKKFSIDETKKVVLFFGLIRAYKGLDILIEAFSKLPADFHLIIAGESYEDFTKYQKIIDKYNLNEQITLKLDFLSDEEVSHCFSAADLCVLPYKSATQSGIIAVANHFEVPVIATNVGGLSESVLHEKEGYIVEANNSQALAQKMEIFFTENKAQEFIQNIQFKKQKLSWDFFADELEKFAFSLKN